MDDAKFVSDGYNVIVTGKNVEVTEALRNYVMEKVEKVEKFADQILDIHVTLDVQKMTQRVTIVMKFSHFKIQVHAATGDLYSAIDKASEKLLALIRKYKSKLRDHHAKHLSSVDLAVNVLQQEPSEEEEINDMIEEENLQEEEERYRIHRVVSKETMPLKMLTQDEAIMKMELSGDSFMIYEGEETKKIHVIYRRQEDGEYGIVNVEK